MLKFQHWQTQHNNQNEDGMETCSPKEQDLEIDDDACSAKISKIECLSCYHMDDGIKHNGQDPLLLYLCIDNEVLNKQYKGKPLIIVSMQNEQMIAGDFVMIANNSMFAQLPWPPFNTISSSVP